MQQFANWQKPPPIHTPFGPTGHYKVKYVKSIHVHCTLVYEVDVAEPPTTESFGE